MMFKRRIRKSTRMFFAGLTAGLLVGAGMALGMWLATAPSNAPQFETPIFASASHGGENFAMATGLVDEEAEGIYTLDFVTGELQCSVINARTGKFNAKFNYNVLADLEFQKGKKPSFAITTGLVDFQRGGGANRPAKAVVYVADCNSGNVAAYYLLWNRTAAATGRPQGGTMTLLGKFRGRSVTLRE